MEQHSEEHMLTQINNHEYDFIFIIFSCEKYRYKIQYQKQLWLNKLNPNILYFHIIGKEHMKDDYIVDIKNKILYVKVKDDYNSLPKKVIKTFKIINDLFKFKYIFKTDDDQFLNNLNIINIINNVLNSSNPKIHYAGHIIDVKTPHISQYFKIHPELPHNLLMKKTKYCSGRFYALSHQAIEHLIAQHALIESEYFEDYAIGLNLLDAHKTNILDLKIDTYFKDIIIDKDKNVHIDGVGKKIGMSFN